MMIRYIRILGLSMLAVFAVGVVMSASASAHAYFVCEETGTSKYTEHLCTTKGETGKWSYTGVKTPVAGYGKVSALKLETELAGTKIIMEGCAHNGETEGSLEEKGKRGGGDTGFSECHLYEVKENQKDLLSCTAKSGGGFGAASELVTGQASGPELQYAARAFTLDISGCALEGKYPVTHTEVEVLPAKQKYSGQVCTMPEATVGKLEHEFVCSSAGSHLTFNGAAASFSFVENIHVGFPTSESWYAE